MVASSLLTTTAWAGPAPATYAVSEGYLPADLDQRVTDAPIIYVSPGSYDVQCGVKTCDAVPGTSLTVQGSPAPVAELNLNLPAAGSYVAQSLSALVTYDYFLPGGPTAGTLTINVAAYYSGFNNGANFALASVFMDGTYEASCDSGDPSIGDGQGDGTPLAPAAVSCIGTGAISLLTTIPVQLQASGTITLEVVADMDTDGITAAGAYALADPILTADDGATIILSDGVENAILPEPASLSMPGLSVASLAAFRRRRRVTT